MNKNNKTKSSKTNSIGPGTANIAINLPVGLRDSISAEADANNMKLSEYCRVILADAVAKKVRIKKETTLTPSV